MESSNPTGSSTTADAPRANLKVSIQGYAGAFHEIAARQHFGPQTIEIAPAHTFAEVVQQIESGQSDTGLMAIENTLAGSLMANYDLLQESELRICGEVYLRIEQQLLGLPGATVAGLKEVFSHPIAIAQCRPFFRQYPEIQLIETADTALSAREVLESSDLTQGAIASQLAAELYGLEILAPSIETNKKNHTRFLVLERTNQQVQTGNKVSLSFAVQHTSGSLHRVLAVLAAYELNLSKIQSTPIIGHPWEYRFYVDFLVEGNVSWQQALDGIRPITHDLRVLGVYQQGTKPA